MYGVNRGYQSLVCARVPKLHLSTFFKLLEHKKLAARLTKQLILTQVGM